MQWDEKELDTLFTQKVYVWTPNSEILAKALLLPETPSKYLFIYSLQVFSFTQFRK